MRMRATSTSILASTSLVSSAPTANCVKDSLGNSYCAEVNNITYGAFPGAGTYGKVISMDANVLPDGACTNESYAYKGVLAPFDEEVSWHFRGPLFLKQFAVYTPGESGLKKRDGEPKAKEHHGHVHQHLHCSNKENIKLKHKAMEVRDVENLLVATATFDGVVKTFSFPEGKGNAALPTTLVSAVAPTTAKKTLAAINTPVSSSSLPAHSSNAQHINAGTAAWIRDAYYNAADGTMEGLVFLNHNGTSGISGTYDYAFGASLSYASSDPVNPASSPQVLSNKMIEDNVEVVIMSDKVCENDDCGFTRPDGVAHHGFAGPSQAFLFEFSMPISGKQGWKMDMPAIWLLNAQVPRTLQYGNPECSCWPLCGEIDIFEILDPGYDKCISSLHPLGGSASFFSRPSENTIKVAVVFSEISGTVRIEVLDNEQGFDEGLADDVVERLFGGGGRGTYVALD